MPNPIKLTKRATAPKSSIRVIFDQIPEINLQRKNQGLSPVVSLGIGQPHLAGNPVVFEDLSMFLASAQSAAEFGYSPAQGRPETLDAIVRLYNDYYSTVNYTNRQVMVTNGASAALSYAFSILIDVNDEVVVFQPYFSTYKGQIETVSGKLVCIPTVDNKFKPSAQSLRQTLDSHPKVKAIILNYPNNPSGLSLTEDELRELAAVLRDYWHVAIIIDDVYRELCFGKHLTLIDIAPDLQDRCIVINSGAKGLTGSPDLRIGMVGANEEWIIAMSLQQLNAVSGVSYITQKAIIFAIDAKLQNNIRYLQWASDCKETYKNNVKYMKKQLAIIGITTDIDVQGGFFLLANAKYLIGKEIPHSIAVALNEGKKIEISELHEKIGSTLFKNDVDIASYLLHAAGVAVIPGSGFGIEPDAGYLRFSCAQPMELLQKAILQITESLKYFKQQKNEYVPMFEAINSSYLDLLFSASHTLEIASQDDFIPESNLIYDPAKYNC